MNSRKFGKRFEQELLSSFFMRTESNYSPRSISTQTFVFISGNSLNWSFRERNKIHWRTQETTRFSSLLTKLSRFHVSLNFNKFKCHQIQPLSPFISHVLLLSLCSFLLFWNTNRLGPEVQLENCTQFVPSPSPLFPIHMLSHTPFQSLYWFIESICAMHYARFSHSFYMIYWEIIF